MSDIEIQAAAKALLKARAGRTKLDLAAYPWQPADTSDAYALQRAVAAEMGQMGGWKVGASVPQAPVMFAPIAASGIVGAGTRLADGVHRMRGIEVEAAFRLGLNLPARAAPYGRDEVVAAIDSAIPVIEVVETRLSDRAAADGLWALADNQSHGELVLGAPVTKWQGLDLETPFVDLRFNGEPILSRQCRNAGGNPVDLLMRLANACNDHCGGLAAGQIVTTGSLMGLELAPFQAQVTATIAGLGSVSVSFG